MSILLLNIVIYFTIIRGEFSPVNFKVIKFEVCNHTRGVIKFHVNITQESDGQYLNLDLDTPVAWDANLGAECRIESKIVGQTFLELFTIREKNACKAAQMYMGEFWYDIMAHTGRPNPRSCPILPGRYHVNHLELNFNTLTLQTFPFGRLRFILKTINNQHPNVYMSCLLGEVENIIN